MQWDVLAGISVGFMVVPQGISYANIAGVPSVYGLYGAFLPVLVYALFGSSKQLGVGPVAVTSMLIGNGIRPMVPGSENIDNPSAPNGPEEVALQDTYNHKVNVVFAWQHEHVLGCMRARLLQVEPCTCSCIRFLLYARVIVVPMAAMGQQVCNATNMLLPSCCYLPTLPGLLSMVHYL